MPLLSRRTAILLLRSPALLVVLMVLRGDCSSISQTMLSHIRDAGWPTDAWPLVVTEFSDCFGKQQLGCYVAAKATYIRLLHGKIGILEEFFGSSSIHRGRTHIVLG